MEVVGFRKDRRTGKNIPITVPVGHTIPSKIFPNQTTFSVTPKNAKLPTIDETVEDVLEKFWNEDEFGRGIDVQTGDCANFAEALQNTIGKGTVVCVYTNKNDEQNEEPTHVALKVDKQLWDGSGKILEKQLLERAKLHNESSKPYIKEATVDQSSGEVLGYRSLIDERRVKKIQKVLQKNFEQKSSTFFC